LVVFDSRSLDRLFEPDVNAIRWAFFGTFVTGSKTFK